MDLGIDTRVTLLAAGLIFLLSLALGVWKYRQMAVAEDHLAHPYVDIAHRAALLYSFATLLIAAFVELSAWPAWVNLTAAMAVVLFFVIAIGTYIRHGAKRDTTNQFANPAPGVHAGHACVDRGRNGWLHRSPGRIRCRTTALVGQVRHLQAGITADEDAARDGGVAVALAHLVNGVIERDGVGIFTEWQLQLLGAAAVDVGNRETD